MRVVLNTLIISCLLLIALFYLPFVCIILGLNTCINPSARLKRKITTLCRRFVYHLTLSALSFWFPHPIFLQYNTNILKLKRTIVISNHCSDYDWLFLFVILRKLGKFDNHYLFLKQELRSVPLLGTILRHFGYIFLNRRKSVDIEIMEKGVQRISKNSAYNVVIYPEGTYMSTEAIEKSKSFAKNTNVEVNKQRYVPDKVLLPRTTGFNIIASELKDSCEGIIDMTILMNPYVYIPCEECTPHDFFLKKSKILNQFILVDLHPMSKVDDNFLIERFKLKDDRIKKYLEFAKGEIKDEKEFLKLLNEFNNTTDEFKTKTLYIYSEYAPIIFILPLICLLMVVFVMLHIYRGWVITA
ncbi:hypothetical protein ENBRE01_0467 [Enteropsectra breve]|nr:hypothetical protein ENBRE01_0467 [Enteropsectra breve]